LTGDNTHLIALEADGAKYEAALIQASMHIVQPSWLDACENTSSRVNESHHLLSKANLFMHPLSSTIANDRTTSIISYSSKSVEDQIQEQLDYFARDDSVLFSNCHFYLLGLDDNSNDSQQQQQQQLGRLIRRGMGIIHWEFETQVTHVVVQLNADLRVR
jgi:hypothetical protein